MTAWALLLALVSAPTPVNLEDCTRTQRGASVRVECVDAVATRVVLAAGTVPRDAAVAFRAGLLRTLPLAEEPVDADVKVGARTARGWTIHVKQARKDPRPTASVDVVVTALGSRDVLVSCTRKAAHRGGTARCALLLEALMRDGPVPGQESNAPAAETGSAETNVPADAANTAHAPDAGAVPTAFPNVGEPWMVELRERMSREGCSSATDRVKCPAGELRWRALSPDDAAVEVREGMARAALEQLGAVVPLGCSGTSPLGDVNCRALAATLAEGKRLDLVVAVVTRDGNTPLLLECWSPSSLRDGVPEPCSSVLSVTVTDGR